MQHSERGRPSSLCLRGLVHQDEFGVVLKNVIPLETGTAASLGATVACSAAGTFGAARVASGAAVAISDAAVAAAVGSAAIATWQQCHVLLDELLDAFLREAWPVRVAAVLLDHKLTGGRRGEAPRQSVGAGHSVDAGQLLSVPAPQRAGGSVCRFPRTTADSGQRRFLHSGLLLEITPLWLLPGLPPSPILPHPEHQAGLV